MVAFSVNKQIQKTKCVKKIGFDRNGRHHEARLEKMMQNAMVKGDFRATATHFVHICVFLLIFEILVESSIACAEYSVSKVRF